MKTAIQQQIMTAGRKALGLSLLASTALASLQSKIMTTLNRITEAGSKRYRAIASVRAIDLCTPFGAPNHQHKQNTVRFYGCDLTHACNIRGGNP